MASVNIVGPSKWKFLSFGSGGISVVISASLGTVQLLDPSNTQVNFWYGGVGGGWSAGLKLPKIGKIRLRAPTKTGSLGPTAFPSAGTVLVTENCPGPDLTTSDLQGPCAFVDAGGGLGVGASGTVMLAGLYGPRNPSLWQEILGDMVPIARVYQILGSARAVIPMAGVNAAFQAGGGVTGYVGFMW